MTEHALTTAVRHRYMDSASLIDDIINQIAGNLGYYQGNFVRMRELQHLVSNETIALEQFVRSYYTNDIAALFEEGFASASGGIPTSPADRRIYRGIARDGRSAMLRSHQTARADSRRAMSKLYRATGREAEAFARTDGIKAHTYADGRKYSLDGYAQQRLRSDGSRAYNAGVLHGGRAAGVRYYEVEDGPECGWSSHDDPERADGKLVTADEGMTYLIAHPSCVRRFVPRRDLTRRKHAQQRVRQRAQNIQEKLISLNLRNTMTLKNATALIDKQQLMFSISMDQLMKAQPIFKEFERRLQFFAHEMQVRREVRRGLEEIEKFRRQPHEPLKITAEEVADEVVVAGEQFAMAGRPLPQYTQRILGVTDDMGERAVGDRLYLFNQFNDIRKRSHMPAHVVENIHDFEESFRDTFLRVARNSVSSGGLKPPPAGPGGILPKLTFPRVGAPGSKHTSARIIWTDNPIVRVTTTFTELSRGMTLEDWRRIWDYFDFRDWERLFPLLKTEIIENLRAVGQSAQHRVTFNPHGLFRMGLSRDPVTNELIPDFRLVPGKIISVGTEYSRSVGMYTKQDFLEIIRNRGQQIEAPGFTSLRNDLSLDELRFLAAQRGWPDPEGMDYVTLRRLQSGIQEDELIGIARRRGMKTLHEYTTVEHFSREYLLDVAGVDDIAVRSWRSHARLLIPSPLKIQLNMVNREIHAMIAELRMFSGKVYARFIASQDDLTVKSAINTIQSRTSQLNERLLGLERQLVSSEQEWLTRTARRSRYYLNVLNGGVFQIARILKMDWQQVRELIRLTEIQYEEILKKIRNGLSYSDIDWTTSLTLETPWLEQ